MDILIIIWLILMGSMPILIFGASIFFVREAQKNKKMESLRKYYLGLSLFFFFIAVNGVFDVLEQYYHYYLGRATLFPPEYQVLPGGTNITTTTFYIITSLLMASFSVLCFEIEKNIRQKDHKPTVVILVICFFISLLPYFGPLYPANIKPYIILLVNGTMLPFALIIIYIGVFYLVIAKNSVGAVRHKALMVALGLGFIMGAIIFDTVYRMYMESNGIPVWWYFSIICKIVGILGIFMMVFGFRREDSDI